MKIRKDVNVIITFDDKEYSEEETAILYQQFFESLAKLYQQFFESLAKIKGVKIPEYAGKALAKALRAKEKISKEIRTPKTDNTKEF